MTKKYNWLYDLALLVVLIAAAYLRVVGLNWDNNQHLHPDERFLTMVESALIPAQSLSEYFDTTNSQLNPHNRGYGFFVYGNFPINIVRYLAEWLGQGGYDEVALVGRQFSALADLGVIILLYFIASRLYGRKVALLAASFSSFAVMQIQQSHFFTVDNPANFFSFLAILFAVWISTKSRKWELESGKTIIEIRESEEQLPNDASRITSYDSQPSNIESRISHLNRDPIFWLSIAFGISLGMAIASKLNVVPMAVLLPIALVLHFLQKKEETGKTDNLSRITDSESQITHYAALITNNWHLLTIYLLAGGIATIFAFRIFMPYAFDGIGFNDKWLANISELQAQSSGDADVPFALQWARRSHFYSVENLTKWGLGLPLGILAWIGFLAMGWRILKGEQKHILLWGWTALYFLWQSMAFNPTMRYQLPIYPLLCLMAAWGIITLSRSNVKTFKYLAILTGALVLIATAAWAYAFTRIYTRPHPRVEATQWIYQNLPGPINLHIQTENGIYQQPLPFSYGSNLSNTPAIMSFIANESGTISEFYLPNVSALMVNPLIPNPPTTDSNTAPILIPDFAPASDQTLSLILSIVPEPTPEQTLATSTLTDKFRTTLNHPRGTEYILKLDKPARVIKGDTYFFTMQTTGILGFKGAAPINETSWDDGLPLRMDGYDGFGGLYDGTLNQEMYWDDNLDKIIRFVSNLTKGDYIFISSNRQWASVTRIPERYPLTTAYYRALIGCPPQEDVIWCYNVAKPGQFEQQLGYDLIKVFESYPTLEIPGVFKWEINDQFAEEAFTVYDHTKVLIFKKTKEFNSAKVDAFFKSVDLSNVVHLTPKQANNYKNPMLSASVFAKQRAGGTWSELFDYNSLQNKYPIVGLVIWYLFIFLLGLVTYPITRLALSGLMDKGYALSRVAGLALLAYLSWMSGSVGLGYTRETIGGALAIIAVAGISLGWMRKDQLVEEWKSNRRYILLIEGIFLAVFLIDLFIRFMNPDLWHPAKGGERPMDFSYLNAVLKSTSFPPYDPWFAGGYINYYYYGFVLVGTPVKLLGIVPSIAYNFILPTLFALIGIGAFTVGWNLLHEKESKFNAFDSRLIAGISSLMMTILLGNLGTIRMIQQGFQRLGTPTGLIPVDSTMIQRFMWGAQGLWKSLSTGAALPYGRGDWYWFPSRVIPAPFDVEPINEFPLFTFLYSDLHAHMIVLPLTLFIIAWIISFIKSRAQLDRSQWIATFIAGGLFIGALKPTNTWDLYTYLALACVTIIYVITSSDLALRDKAIFLTKLGIASQRTLAMTWKWLFALIAAGLLYALSSVFYLPFTQSFSQAYGAVQPWTGSHTPIWSYFAHWGLFLFIIIAWLAWETREWMAATPVSALSKLRPYQLAIELSLAAVAALMLYFAINGISVGWFALPLAVWAGVLLLRPNSSDIRRFVLFMIGTSLTLTIVVELIVLVGDIGRMNTVFKLYLQAWVMLAVSAGAALGWVLPAFVAWRASWRNVYQYGVWLLLVGASLFTISATTDKMSDRIDVNAPRSLDSMDYMKTATHWDGDTMILNEDYLAIRWMQDNVQGSPVIVEANCTEYRWCTRFTVYTGLPGVVGWNWHQRQQRGVMSITVQQRVDEIGAFYNSIDGSIAPDFLSKYQVKYIVVGQLERNLFSDGIAKFEQFNGKFWKSVYHDSKTTIYEVLP